MMFALLSVNSNGAKVASVPNFNVQEFIKHFNAKLVPAGFNYNSGDNTEWETVTTLRQLIKEHVDSNFKA